MPNLVISIPHQLTRAEAKRRIQNQMSQLFRDQGMLVSNVQEAWTDDTLNFSATLMGQKISGQAAVEDQAVCVEIELPWLLNMLAGGVKQKIEQQGRRLLSRPAS